MAKGNIGNLLQHFIGLSCAKRLVDMSAGKPIEYIDCFSMSPWEPIDGSNAKDFKLKVLQFEKMKTEGDFVASVFLAAWARRYGENVSLPEPLRREYPNTAVLLRTAFPDQPWNMRLHDADPTNRQNLEQWSREQSPGSYRVDGDWTRSSLISKAPIPPESAAMVMLDPYQIVRNDHERADESGYLPERRLRFLHGAHALNVQERTEAAQPLVVTLFSYSDFNPNNADRVVRNVFSGEKWKIERVMCPCTVRGHQAFHQGWAVSQGISAPLELQTKWNGWACYMDDT